MEDFPPPLTLGSWLCPFASSDEHQNKLLSILNLLSHPCQMQILTLSPRLVVIIAKRQLVVRKQNFTSFSISTATLIDGDEQFAGGENRSQHPHLPDHLQDWTPEQCDFAPTCYFAHIQNATLARSPLSSYRQVYVFLRWSFRQQIGDTTITTRKILLIRNFPCGHIDELAQSEASDGSLTHVPYTRQWLWRNPFEWAVIVTKKYDP